MQYAVLGKTGYRVSRLGFGAMRLPVKGERINRDKAVPMLRRAIELGVNYIDTAAGYNAGDSERVIGEAVRGMRDRVILSTKNPHYDKRHDRPWWQNLEGSLKRLAVEVIDLYHFHFLNWDSFQKHVAGADGQLRWAQKALGQGLIKHICFSFHDKPENLIKLADTGEFDSVTLQYNLIDRSNEKGIDYLARKNMGVVVMGPVGGGRLGAPSKALRKMLPEARSVPEVALRFVLANPSVTVALSGMSEMAHVEENTRVAAQGSPLSPAEKRRVRLALARYQKLSDLYCTGCNYCMPCPWGVEIPENFSALNSLRVYDLAEHARQRYRHIAGKAATCVACGSCMRKCPQHIDIINQLRQTVRTLDEAYGNVVVKFEPVEVLRLGDGRRMPALLDCRMEAHNLSDQEAAPRVDLHPAPGTTATVEGKVRPLRPFSRSRSNVTVELDSIAGGGRIELKPSVAAPLKMVCATPTVAFAIAKRIPGSASRAPSGGRPRTTSRGGSLALSRLSPVVNATLTPGAGKNAPRIQRDFALAAHFAHDTAGLILQFEVRGPFTADEEQKQLAASPWWSNRVVVAIGLLHQPGIVRLKAAPANFESRLFLTPGRFDVPSPQLTEAELKKVSVDWSGTPERRVITARVPWKILRVSRPKPPARLALSFRFLCPHPVRGPSATLAWTENNPGYLMLVK